MKSNRIFTSNEFTDRRKILRKNLTPQEQVLWKNLRNKRSKFKFRRQHSIGPYIADFYCVELKLVIELDGEHHKEREAMLYDKDRTEYFKASSIKVLRFWNSEVDTDLTRVLKIISEHTLPFSM